MQNTWLEVNRKRINRIKRQLVEYTYSGSYGGNIPLMEINSILDGASGEIAKLQNKIKNLTEELKKKEEAEELKKKEEGKKENVG